MKSRVDGNSFALIGASRAGVSLAYHLSKKGYRPVYCWNRSADKYEEVERYVGFEKVLDSLEKVDSSPEIIIIAVSDGVIEEVAVKISNSWKGLSGKIAFHISGALSSDVLVPLQEKGVKTGSLHPFMSIPDIRTGIERIPDTIFTCEGEIASFLRDIARKVGKDGVVVTKEQKVALHISAVFLSNYLVTMISEVRDFVRKKKVDEAVIAELFRPILEKSVERVLKSEFSEAITGPILRDDEETVKRHLKFLKDNERLRELYLILGRITCEKIIGSNLKVSCKVSSLFEMVEG